MNAFELTVGISLVANTISCNLSNEEISLMAAVITQLGDTLNTIVAQRVQCDAGQAVATQTDAVADAGECAQRTAVSGETQNPVEE